MGHIYFHNISILWRKVIHGFVNSKENVEGLYLLKIIIYVVAVRAILKYFKDETKISYFKIKKKNMNESN